LIKFNQVLPRALCCTTAEGELTNNMYINFKSKPFMNISNKSFLYINFFSVYINSPAMCPILKIFNAINETACIKF